MKLSQNLSEKSNKLKLIQISKFEGQNGRGLGHVTYFQILGSPIYLEWIKLETSNLMWIDRQTYKPKMQQ